MAMTRSLLLRMFAAAPAVALLACASSPSQEAGGSAAAEEQETMNEAAAARWAPASCDDMDAERRLVGETPESVTAKIGEPESRETRRMGDLDDEFHAPLQNTYPLTTPGNAEVEVQEWRWKSGDCNLAVWFHAPEGEWTAFETAVWSDDMEF